MATAASLFLFACSNTGITLPESIGTDFDLAKTLNEIRDCDVLSDTFVGVVRQAADEIDDLAASSGGRVPAPELAGRVDVLVQHSYFAIAERLGCNAVAQRVDTLDRLRQLSPSSDQGEDLVTDVINQLDQAR